MAFAQVTMHVLTRSRPKRGMWNRRQRKRGGRLNPPEKWAWSEEPAHDPLVSREMFDRANVTAIKRDNVTRAAEGHEEHRRHTYVAAVIPALRDMRAADARQRAPRQERRVLHVRAEPEAVVVGSGGAPAYRLSAGGQGGGEGRRVPEHARVRARARRGA